MSGKRAASETLAEEPDSKAARLAEDAGKEKPVDGTDEAADQEEPTRRSSRARKGGAKGKAEPAGKAAKGGVKGVELVMVTYKEGAGLGEHLKQGGDVVEVKIAAESTVSGNPQVRARQLWGTDIYTCDSDLVAVLMHHGYYLPSASVPPSLVELRAVVKAVPSIDSYVSVSRNGVRSRSWGAVREGVSFTVESCKAVLNPGKGVKAGALASGAKSGSKPTVGEKDAKALAAPGTPSVATPTAEPFKDTTVEAVLHPSTTKFTNQMPTFFPNTVESVVNTRHSAANSERRGKLIQEVTVQYNLVNEPWLKYSAAAVADTGFKKSTWTAARLRRESLFLESHHARYELSFDGDAEAVDDQGNGLKTEDFYRFGKCVAPKTLTETMAAGVPLPANELVDLKKKINWHDVKFGANSFVVEGEEIKVVRLQFMART